MRERIRARLRELGADEAARATEGAFISTIHGFCARVLRAHALAAGLDPAFAVLDAPDAERLADGAFDDALEELGADGAGRDRPDRRATAPAGCAARSSRSTTSCARAAQRAPAAAARCGRRPTSRRRGASSPTRPRGRARGARRDRRTRAPRCIEALARLERCAEADLGGRPVAGRPVGACACRAATAPRCRPRRACATPRRSSLPRGLRAPPRDPRRTTCSTGCCACSASATRAPSASVSGLDFEDLELEARELLHADTELRERYRTRFERIMVDELQDTNRVQLELIELDRARQPVHGRRRPAVDLRLPSRRRGAVRAARRGSWPRRGARATLDTNFRSRPEILAVINGVFERALGEHFRPLRAGRGPDEPAERAAGRADRRRQGGGLGDGGAGRAVAGGRGAGAGGRLERLLAAGTVAARDVVLLTRATTDLRVYERALEDRGIPTYVIGGRGYWAHPQVIDMVSYLEALANPRAEEALYTVLASPLVGVSADALVCSPRRRGRARCDPWSVLREPDGAFDGLGGAEPARLEAFAGWFAERAACGGPDRRSSR